jgi:pyruvate formate lyase activating enzyme
MKIAGLEKNSLVDYPGKIAAVVFAPGCNLDCYYCHNRILLGERGLNNLIPKEDVFNFLEKRVGLLDGVVISGGEPTIQRDLGDFIHAVRDMGYSIKLDTNGSNPQVLRDLLRKSFIDYVAMDIKAPLKKYKEVCMNKADGLVGMDNIYSGDSMDFILEGIKESIEILLNGKIEYEFRTTFVPALTQNDILEIAGLIRGARLYALQQYRVPDKTGDGIIYDKNRRDLLFNNPHSPAFIIETAEKINGMVKKCITRGI